MHGRVLASCRNLAADESIPEYRRRFMKQLDELLQPWSSADSLKRAPYPLVENLVATECTLEERFRGEYRPRGRRVKRMVVASCVAGSMGVLLAIVLSAIQAGASSPISESVWAVTATISTYIRRMSFVEHFAIAVLASWLLGTWLLSNVYKS